METTEQARDIHIAQIMNNWRDGTLSDVEVLYELCAYLPSNPVTDVVIEVVGKMQQEEVAEWPNPDDTPVLADMIHGPEGVISEAKTLEQADWDIEPLSDEDRKNFAEMLDSDDYEPNR